MSRCNVCHETYVGLAQDCRCTNYGKVEAERPTLGALRLRWESIIAPQYREGVVLDQPLLCKLGGFVEELFDEIERTQLDVQDTDRAAVDALTRKDAAWGQKAVMFREALTQQRIVLEGIANFLEQAARNDCRAVVEQALATRVRQVLKETRFV